MNNIRNNKFRDLVRILKNVNSYDIEIYQSKSANKFKNFKQFHKLSILTDLNFKSDCKENNTKKKSDTKIQEVSQYNDNNYKHFIKIKDKEITSTLKSYDKSTTKTQNRVHEHHTKLDLPKSLCCFIGYNFISINSNQFDSYAKIFMKTIDPIFRSLNDKKFIELHLKQLKIKMIDIFNKQDFYKKYEFSSKDFKKSELEETFMNNGNVTINMLKVFANIFDTNLIFKDLNLDKSDYQYFNNFIPDRLTIVLFQYNTKIYSIVSKKSNYVRGIELSKYLGYNKIFTESDLLKDKLDKIQNIAKMKNIFIKKQGKTGKINKKKDELVKEIINS